MSRLPLVAALLAGIALAQDPDININARYTVESVEVAAPARKVARLPQPLRDQMQSLIGSKVDHTLLEDISRRLKRELKASSVVPKIVKGDQPDHVKVVFQPAWRVSLKASSEDANLVYHSKQGWSGQFAVSTEVGKNVLGAGIVSDNDKLLERYAGIRAFYRRQELGSDRLRLGMEFETFHQQWNRATEEALRGQETVPGIYRTRYNLQPVLTVVIAEPLTLSAGVSFQRFQTQYPAAVKESSNAAITSLRYRRRWEGPGVDRHDLNAGYSLHAATNLFDTDYVFTRNAVDVSYRFRRDDNTLLVRFEAGNISGRAPLFARFVAGNAATLRGWNKFDIAPLGGDRLAAGSLEYRYRVFQIFYDAGAVWDHGRPAEQRNSIGLGLGRWGLRLAVAFPIKYGRVEPAFIFGMDL